MNMWEESFDPYGDDEEPGDVTCKHCGRSGFQWEDDNGRWVLVSPSGRIHKCEARRPTAKQDFS